MFTRKDREIANLTAMVTNRDKKIKELLIDKTELQDRTTGLLKIIYDIKKLSGGNTYDNPESILRKINELTQIERE